MTDFVTSVVDAAQTSARSVAKRTRGKPTARRLLKSLEGKKRILVTSHVWPDPDAIASAMAMCTLLRSQLPGSQVDMSIKGDVAVGINAPFARLANPELLPWDDARVAGYDAIVLLDVQPSFGYSPLPQGVEPFAIVDHHRARGRRPVVEFVDIRTDVGASTSIVFSYLREMNVQIDSSLAATLLYAIESDLAGAAGHPGELDNIALSNLTLIADPRRLYQMRHAPLPREYYVVFDHGLREAVVAGPVMASFLGDVQSPEIPALIADFLLRYDQTRWVLVTAIHQGRLVLSLRTNEERYSAGEMMRNLVHRMGEGGGHRTKAGGFIKLDTGSQAEIDRIRKTLRKRLLKLLELHGDTRFQPLLRSDDC